MTGLVGTVLGDILAQVSSYHLSKQRDRLHLRAAQRLAATASASHGPHKGKAGCGKEADGDQEEGEEGYTKEGLKMKFSYDFERTLRLVVWSVLVGTPIGHFWYMCLDRNVFPSAPTSGRAVLAKLALDQLLMAPAGTALFFWGFKLLEGGSLEEARANVTSKFAPTLTANYVLWPAANYVNFRWVPSEQRILYINVIALFWTAYMSHMASKTTPATAAAHAHTVHAPATASLTSAASLGTSSRSRHAVLHMGHQAARADTEPASPASAVAMGRSRRAV